MISEKGTTTNHESRLCILIVEDEEFNFLFYREVLNKYETTLFRAVNGREAVDICTENNDIQIILMDIRMPVMDGYEATRQIKRIRPNLPIIAQTAYALESDRKMIFEEGFDDYLPKPIRSMELVNYISKHLPARYKLVEKTKTN